MWEPYKAAMTALKNTLDIQHVREIHAKQVGLTQSNLEQLETLLTEGVLTEEALLDNSHGFLNCLRECNASLRWAMMHRNSRNKKLRDIVIASLDPNRVLLLLLQSAQLEFRVGELYKQLLAHKDQRWAKARSECALRVTELAHLFSGEQVLTRNIKDRIIIIIYIHIYIHIYICVSVCVCVCVCVCIICIRKYVFDNNYYY
jgi:WASH complex subunit strumpellin